MRNGRYYAQLSIEDHETGHKKVRRVPLEDAITPAQARDKMNDLLASRRKGHLPILKRTPKFSEYADTYLEFHKHAKDAKKASTMETEEYAIDRWKEHLKDVRLNQIRPVLINSFIAKRQKAGRSARTVNLEVTVLRNVLNRAIDEKWITQLPTQNLRPLKSAGRKRDFTPATEIDRLCHVALQPLFCEGRLALAEEKGEPLQNGQQFADYIRLMTYCGARLAETLRLRWSDINWEKRQLTVGSEGNSKNRKWRVVDFNPELESLLKEMLPRRTPDLEWLFPSPRRGEKDHPAKTFRESLILARTAAKLPKFGFHDCRHHFISQCVMAGIDYMTIARWVGHQDGGILIGKVYGHLSNEHAQLQAQKLNFGDTNEQAKAQ
ncbi:tyrosine-type recombinase/integrase [Pedosphaera parvula]|uniref:Integrase family protein n=1 Tax=Pedosphaera parvula (strain Ellin514) TaxID=320771 RepID=B9XHN2_PEDPL|nr:integrase [Pedosphaera parvula]EEF60610.1 integrase family protein [Pedosphaera parvula Ellin514]